MKNLQRNKFYNWDKFIWNITIIVLNDQKENERHSKERIELYMP